MAGKKDKRDRGAARPDDSRRDTHAKGAMREPAQTPGADSGELKELRQALENVEKQEGDWSKGG